MHSHYTALKSAVHCQNLSRNKMYYFLLLLDLRASFFLNKKQNILRAQNEVSTKLHPLYFQSSLLLNLDFISSLIMWVLVKTVAIKQ